MRRKAPALTPLQHDLWVLVHVADRDDGERRERADDGLRGAGEQHRPDGGGGGLDRLHHQQGGWGDETGGEGAQGALDDAVILCSFRFRDYETPCKYLP